MHYGQLIQSAKFQKYDFGSDRSNKSAYGSTSPPLIPLSAIAGTKVAYFVGAHDTLGDPTDSKIEYAALGSGIGVFYKEYANCDHYSFMVGKDTSFNADILAQLPPVTGSNEESTEEIDNIWYEFDQVPADYPFVEDESINLY